MKFIKILLKILPMAAFVFAFPLQAEAGRLTGSVKTGDGGLVGIAIAVAACILTAFVTMRLTKRKNKK
ncbi:MAG: hypothetical protein FWD23_15835 [Oscillospiraceae bacterium]|nr:hypothetical protein [Oscillospiraceae bacterium]